MFRIGVVFDRVAGFLAFVVHFVFLHVALIDVLGGHAESLGQRDEEVKEIDHFDAGVLFVDLLIFGPPFPRETVDQLSEFLRHGAGVVESPLGFFVWGEVGKIDPDLFVEEVLHTEDFV